MPDRTQKEPLVPKLRFPEFQDAGEWEVKRLRDVFQERSERNGYGLELLSVTLSDGVVKSSQLDKKINTSADLSNYKKVYPNDIVYNSMRMWQGASGVSKWHGIVSPAYTVITPLAKQDSFFWGYYLKHPENIDKFARFSQGVTSDTWNLKFPAFSRIRVPVPSLPEQQKIADCLSSLDELIRLEAQKCTALKAHKKGLMQQLFPQEGETTPRLRFPEFKDAGEWKTVPLGNLLERNPEYGVNAPAAPYSPYLPTYLRITDIDDDGRFLSNSRVSVDIVATENNYLEPGDIVLARTGASVGKSYRYRKEDGRLVFAGFLIRIRPNRNKVNPIFLANFFNSQRYWNWVALTSARSGQPGISGKEYSSLPVPLPPKKLDENGITEQDRIANCLSSLDELIERQSRKVEALKMLKKGLMQQLFPQEVV